MDNKFLQEFLKTGLFDIGDSDDRLKYLQKSITDLQRKFKDDYSLLPTYTLVVLDPNISDTEPVLAKTETIITEYWEVLRVKYPKMPIPIIRGVILNSLYNIGISNALAARIIYLTALNFYPYAKLNNEKDLVKKMLSELGEVAEEDAVEEWSLIEEEPKLKLETLKIGKLKFEAINIDKDDLTEKWEEAFTTAPDGHGPQHGLGNISYRKHFTEKTTNAIVSSFDDAFGELNKSLSSTDISTPINKFFVAFKKNLDANLKLAFSSLTAVERRSKLLWWKETLYSPSQKKSYREFDKKLLPLLMSNDLNDQIPKVTPISVDFLLKDTLYLLNEKQDTSITFSEYFSEISDDKSKSILKPYFNIESEEEGRISITEFISLLIDNRVTIDDFYKRTGIKVTESITYGDLAVAVLHDLLVQRLITK